MAFRKWEFESRGYRVSFLSGLAWECPLCAELATGDRAPDECPVCLAPGTSFKRIMAESPSPVPVSTQAPRDARASECARKDGRPWNISTKSWRSSAHPKPA